MVTAPKGADRGARRDVYQKATGIEGAYRDESGGARAVHDGPHRPTRAQAAALWGLPATVSEGAQHAQGAGMARSIDAEIAVEIALPPPPSRMSQVRLAGVLEIVGAAQGDSEEGYPSKAALDLVEALKET